MDIWTFEEIYGGVPRSRVCPLSFILYPLFLGVLPLKGPLEDIHWTSTCYCNTLVLTPFALSVHDVSIVINRGMELKAKAPPSIRLCYVSAIGIITDGIS